MNFYQDLLDRLYHLRAAFIAGGVDCQERRHGVCTNTYDPLKMPVKAKRFFEEAGELWLKERFVPEEAIRFSYGSYYLWTGTYLTTRAEYNFRASITNPRGAFEEEFVAKFDAKRLEFLDFCIELAKTRLETGK